jgi:hypothetical protein
LTASEISAASTKKWMPFRLHQSPLSVPDTRSSNATLLPVSMALAGHTSLFSRHNVTVVSTSAHTPIVTRI